MSDVPPQNNDQLPNEELSIPVGGDTIQVPLVPLDRLWKTKWWWISAIAIFFPIFLGSFYRTGEGLSLYSETLLRQSLPSINLSPRSLFGGATYITIIQFLWQLIEHFRKAYKRKGDAMSRLAQRLTGLMLFSLAMFSVCFALIFGYNVYKNLLSWIRASEYIAWTYQYGMVTDILAVQLAEEVMLLPSPCVIHLRVDPDKPPTLKPHLDYILSGGLHKHCTVDGDGSGVPVLKTPGFRVSWDVTNKREGLIVTDLIHLMGRNEDDLIVAENPILRTDQSPGSVVWIDVGPGCDFREQTECRDYLFLHSK
jgi:hypothetical protein